MCNNDSNQKTKLSKAAELELFLIDKSIKDMEKAFYEEQEFLKEQRGCDECQ